MFMATEIFFVRAHRSNNLLSDLATIFALSDNRELIAVAPHQRCIPTS
jgi:hypothetical protein